MKKLKGFVGKFLALSFTVGIMSISLITPSYAGQINSSKDLPYERNMHTGSNYSLQILRDESTQISENAVDENSESQNTDQEKPSQEKSVEFSNNADSSDLEESDINSKEQIENTNQGKPDFTDISETDWFYADVMELAGMGIIAGYPSGEFAATDYITSEQFIKMVVVAMKYQLSDLDNKWYEKYTDVLYAKGITSDNFIKYEQAITREQIARLVARVMKQEGLVNNNSKDKLIQNVIADYNNIDDEYKQDVKNAYYFGIMQGDKNHTISPKSYLTRAEAAAMIIRMIDSSRRLPVDLVDNSLFKVTNYDGTETEINIPYYDGVLQKEMGEVIDILISSSEKTKGWEDYGLQLNDKSLYRHNLFGVNGYETEEKLKFMTRTGLSDAELNEKLVMMPYKQDSSTTVNFDYFDKIGKSEAPYCFRISKNLRETEQEKYDHNYAEYKAYFLEYYEEMYADTFKYLFEDDYDEVWELFCTGLENRYAEYTVMIGESKVSHVEKWLVYNDRQVYIDYNANYLRISVSLKGVRADD